MDLSTTEVRIWTFRFPGEEKAAWSEAWLSEEERDRAERYHFPADRQRFTYFHAMMRRLLASVLSKGTDARELRFQAGEFGKPWLVDVPQLHFNLSHSQDQAVLAATWIGPVGIDVERVDDEFPVQEIAREYFVGEERAAIENAPTKDQRTLRFFQYWTAKEAVMKVTGLGMSLEPRSIELALETGTACPVGFHHVAGFPRASVDWRLRTKALGNAAILSLVCPSHATEVQQGEATFEI